jgi:hypothetical protein
MTHPLYHREDSLRIFGGDFETHLDVHNWVDGTKVHFADARHRALRHNQQAVFDRFSGFPLKIAVCHIIGDCNGFLPTLEDWVSELPLEPWMGNPDLPLAELLIQRYGGTTENYEKILEYFKGTDPRLGYLKLHSLGIFEAEEKLGLKIEIENGWVPTRYVGEFIVKNSVSCGGRIPTVADWLKRMHRKVWMNKPFHLEKHPELIQTLTQDFI